MASLVLFHFQILFSGMVWNFRRIIKEDQEELAASREKSLAASSLMEKATNGTSAQPGSVNEN